jgi:hypothetical protein
MDNQISPEMLQHIRQGMSHAQLGQNGPLPNMAALGMGGGQNQMQSPWAMMGMLQDDPMKKMALMNGGAQ